MKDKALIGKKGQIQQTVKKNMIFFNFFKQKWL